jgi:tetratricopeptide (TPR) repeat protein
MRQSPARPSGRVVAAPSAKTQADHPNGRRNQQYASALRNFDSASRLFRKQEYGKAKEIFERLAATAPPELAERARLHLRLCESRTRRRGPLPKTATDYYVMGVAELNSRHLEAAVGYLDRADQLQPEREEIKYALAAAHALQGHVEEALTHLEATVALRPANSFQARQDEDFAPLADDPRFRALVYAGGGSTPMRRS